MTVKQIAEQVKRIDTGMNLNITEKMDDREVFLLVTECVGEVAQENSIENAGLEGVRYVDNMFISTFKNVPVSFDKDLGMYFSLLPEVPISLPRTGGVMEVRGMKAQTKSFMPIDATAPAMFSSLEAFSRPNVNYYYVSGGTVWYRICGKVMEEKNVLMRLVSAGDAVIPTNYCIKILVKAFQILAPSVQIPQDKINDAVHNR